MDAEGSRQATGCRMSDAEGTELKMGGRGGWVKHITGLCRGVTLSGLSSTSPATWSQTKRWLFVRRHTCSYHMSLLPPGAGHGQKRLRRPWAAAVCRQLLAFVKCSIKYQYYVHTVYPFSHCQDLLSVLHQELSCKGARNSTRVYFCWVEQLHLLIL